MSLRTIAICTIAVLCAACGKVDIARPSPALSEARQAQFRNCMELAAKLARQGDDDVSNVVTECHRVSIWQTEHIQ